MESHLYGISFCLIRKSHFSILNAQLSRSSDPGAFAENLINLHVEEQRGIESSLGIKHRACLGNGAKQTSYEDITFRVLDRIFVYFDV